MDKLQWGSRKRLRCVKVKECSSSSSVMNGAKSEEESGGNGLVVKKKTTSRVDRRLVAAPTTPNQDNNNDTITNNTSRQLHPACPCPPFHSPNRINRDLGTNRSGASENRKMLSYASPEKEDRYYSTRGSGIGILDDNSKMFMEATKEKKVVVWPKLYVALSSKEKEEDFMAMKGCKPPHRPKKRAKLIQKSVLVSLFFFSLLRTKGEIHHLYFFISSLISVDYAEFDALDIFSLSVRVNGYLTCAKRGMKLERRRLLRRDLED